MGKHKATEPEEIKRCAKNLKMFTHYNTLRVQRTNQFGIMWTDAFLMVSSLIPPILNNSNRNRRYTKENIDRLRLTVKAYDPYGEETLSWLTSALKQIFSTRKKTIVYQDVLRLFSFEELSLETADEIARKTYLSISKGVDWLIRKELTDPTYYLDKRDEKLTREMIIGKIFRYRVAKNCLVSDEDEEAK